MKTPANRAAFTLVEITVAASVLILAIVLALTGFVYLYSETQKGLMQDELDVDVQLAIEQIKRNLRLSALERIAYYPNGPGPYTAISFPLSRDDDGDGAVDLDADGKIIWDKTLVYHVWSGNPNQLRITTFDPRDNNLTDVQRQAQLNVVVGTGSGTGTYNGTNATTKVVFQNLFTWKIFPQSSSYDAYDTTVARDTGVLFGSTVLSNGTHELEFRVTGKNAASTGYRVGIDTLYMSPSYSAREAEAQLPATDVTGPTPTNVYMSAGSWDGNYQLYFPATAVGQTFTLNLENDRWEERNFRATGERHEDTTVTFDTTVSPYDFLVFLDGNRTNWTAALQTGDTNGISLAGDAMRGCVVRALLRGQHTENGNWIETSGGKCRIQFRAGSGGSLRIEDAFIAEGANSDSNLLDTVSATTTRLTFSGSDDVSIAANGSVWSDLVAFVIDKTKNYLVTFVIGNGVGNGNAFARRELTVPTAIGSYVIPLSSSPSESEALQALWSARTDVTSLTSVVSTEAMFATYPTNGLYTSRVFDTAQDAPSYSTIDWSAVKPTGSSVNLRVRSSVSNDMSGATPWTGITPMTSPGAISPGSQRYVQFQAQLAPNSAGTLTPKLKDVTIRWGGITSAVDIGGTFTKGPNYGVFELFVNGQPLKRGVVVELEIFDYVRMHGSSNQITSAAAMEVTPRNSGR
jgi:hypothetical protein